MNPLAGFNSSWFAIRAWTYSIRMKVKKSKHYSIREQFKAKAILETFDVKHTPIDRHSSTFRMKLMILQTAISPQFQSQHISLSEWQVASRITCSIPPIVHFRSEVLADLPLDISEHNFIHWPFFLLHLQHVLICLLFWTVVIGHDYYRRFPVYQYTYIYKCNHHSLRHCPISSLWVELILVCRSILPSTPAGQSWAMFVPALWRSSRNGSLPKVSIEQ